MKVGDIIELDEIAVVEVCWCSDNLMWVLYKDLTRRLLKINDYRIKILHSK